MFLPTKDTPGEIRKADLKNYNLPILQDLYMGDSAKMLSCTVTGQPAFYPWPCLVKGQPKQRMTLDFNHIRQRWNPDTCAAGISVDKFRYDPSGIFRGVKLDKAKYHLDLVEFLTIMPVNSQIHSYITQDSQSGDITLKNFDRAYWPWHLKHRDNWNTLAHRYAFDYISYDAMIDHLSDINYPTIRQRVQLNPDGTRRFL